MEEGISYGRRILGESLQRSYVSDNVLTSSIGWIEGTMSSIIDDIGALYSITLPTLIIPMQKSCMA